ncbi:MAG: hypothetical protein H7Y09_03915 [Chitinophagaceae bacterium]|nr:hypothetical protein [Anaerolineae bacterium]
MLNSPTNTCPANIQSAKSEDADCDCAATYARSAGDSNPRTQRSPARNYTGSTHRTLIKMGGMTNLRHAVREIAYKTKMENTQSAIP